MLEFSYGEDKKSKKLFRIMLCSVRKYCILIFALHFHSENCMLKNLYEQFNFSCAKLPVLYEQVSFVR